MNNITIDNMSLQERLLLLELLSEKVAEELPDSLIATQMVYHARYLNGTKPSRKEHRHDRGMK